LKPAERSRLGVDVAAVSVVEHEHGPGAVVYLLDDPVVAGTNPPALAVDELRAAGRPRVLGKSPYSRADALE